MNADMLQWGRVLMNAETKVLAYVEEYRAWLQWGRVLMNAETSPRLSTIDEPRPASMGPRSHERGNQGSGCWSCPHWRGFNGAAFS